MNAWIALVLALLLGNESLSLEQRLQNAHEAQLAGQLDEAETLYRELTDLFPGAVEPYLGLADVLTARGTPEEAHRLLVNVGRQLHLLTRHEEALQPLRRATEIAPNALEAPLLLARAHLALAQPRAAIKALAPLDSDHPKALLVLGNAYAEADQPAEAEATYRRALTNPNAPNVLRIRLGRLLLEAGRAAAALEVLQEDPDDPNDPEILFLLARAQTESNDVAGAVKTYERLLAQEPNNAQALYNLELLRHQPLRPQPLRPPSSRPEEDLLFNGSEVRLVPVAAKLGISFQHDPGRTPDRHLPETMGSGLAWLDYDGDGWWDLYLVQSGPFPPGSFPLDQESAANRLYRNLEGQGFVDVTAETAAGERSYGQGVLAADLDDDGDTDLYLANFGPDVLLRNDGVHFTDTTREANLGLDGWSAGATAADVDTDGDLDLYVTRYVPYDPAHAPRCADEEGGPNHYCTVFFFTGESDVFYLQEEPGVFINKTDVAGLSDILGRGLSALFMDFDNDGIVDLYVANDMDANDLYRGLGDGTFENFSLLSGAALNADGRAEGSMGLAAGDVNGNGLPDVALSHFDLETNTLYRNFGTFAFQDVSAVSGFGPPSRDRLGFGLVFVDLDLDGDLDAYAANGHIFLETREGVGHAQEDLVLVNDGNGNFRTADAGRVANGVGRGTAWADFDNDGDPDLGVQQNGGPFELLRNDPDRGNSWLGLDVPIGTRATLVTRRDGRERRQVRWATAGGSYQSTSDPRLLFAWTTDDEALELTVSLPGGHRLRLKPPPSQRYLRFH